MAKQKSELFFGATTTPTGFTNPAISIYDGSAEPVVRELLQNTVDATELADRQPGTVRFVIEDVDSSAIPGMNKYSEVFERALVERERWHNGHPSNDEALTTERIRSASSSGQVTILICADDGIGLDVPRMNSLLTPGNTTKGDAGAGAFGIGHHAAFGASDLRYVMYASRYREKTDEPCEEIASGHAILASFLDQADNRCSADGYWALANRQTTLFSVGSDSFPTQAEPLLRQYLKKLEDTGTVVCIAGFNDFRREDDDPTASESIARVAAANFSNAIHNNRLRVSVEDRRTGTHTSIEPATLESILRPISDQRRSVKQGQIRGQLAYDAEHTMRECEIYTLPEELPGVMIKLRLRDGAFDQGNRVHVFRKGMWISSDAERLKRGDFATTNLFDAVVSLSDGELEKLVRDAEGPEHRGIDVKRLRNSKQRKRLRELLEKVGDVIREQAGEVSDLEEFTPDGFATLSGHVIREAEVIRRPRIPAGVGSREGPQHAGSESTNSKTRRDRKSGRPAPGRRPRYRYSIGESEARAGTLTVHLDYQDEVTSGDLIGVRVFRASGSDATCTQPIPDEYMLIRNVTDESGITHTSSDELDGVSEIVVPSTVGIRTLTLEMCSDIGETTGLSVDVVNRSRPKQRKQKAAGKAGASV